MKAENLRLRLGTPTLESLGDITTLLLVGGGGHANVVAEAARAVGVNVAGYFDDRSDAVGPGCPRWGAFQDISLVAGDFPLILAVGDLQVRARCFEQLATSRFCSVIHPTAIVSPSAEVSSGTFVGAGAVVNASAILAPHTIVNTRAVVEHDCQLARNSHVGPGAILGGGVIVGENALVGINASIRPNVTIGPGATVGAGATVVCDVPPQAIVVGTPARPILYRSQLRPAG